MKNYFYLFLVISFISCANSDLLQKDTGYVIYDNDIETLRANIHEFGEYRHDFVGNWGVHGLICFRQGHYPRPEGEGFSTDLVSYYDGVRDDNSPFFHYNDYSAKYLGDKSSKELGNWSRSLEGQDVQFRHINKAGDIIYSEKLRLPEKLELDLAKSDIRPMKEGNIGVFNRNSKFYLRPDYGNKNGLLVYMVHQGRSVNTSLDEIQDGGKDFIERYMYVPVDNGIINFPDKFFEGVQSGGIVNMQIDRSNYKILKLPGKDQKLYTSNQLVLFLSIE